MHSERLFFISSSLLAVMAVYACSSDEKDESSPVKVAPPKADAQSDVSPPSDASAHDVAVEAQAGGSGGTSGAGGSVSEDAEAEEVRAPLTCAADEKQCGDPP